MKLPVLEKQLDNTKPVTTSAGKFEVQIMLDTPSGKQQLLTGEIIILAHNFDYTIKAQTIFNVTGSSTLNSKLEQAQSQGQGVMPDAVPQSGLGYTIRANNPLPIPYIFVLAGLLTLAIISNIFLRKTARSKSGAARTK